MEYIIVVLLIIPTALPLQVVTSCYAILVDADKIRQIIKISPQIYVNGKAIVVQAGACK